jgi:predicted secreted protein
MTGVAFVAHCMLNQNSVTADGAICAGVYSPIVDQLRERGWRIEQMPCPELTFTGLHRFWMVKNQLETTAYRRHCRGIARAVVGAIEVHLRRGDDVIILGIEGSPSLGVHITSIDPGRGGRPVWPDGEPEKADGQGILLEELTAELRERELPVPRMLGILHQLSSRDEAVDRANLAALIGD